MTAPLGTLARVINGRAYKQDELLNSGKYRVLRVGNFFSNGSWYHSDLELDEDKYCEEGDLLFAWSASFGPRIWSDEKVIYHYHIWKIVEDPRLINRKFLYYFLMNSVKGMMASTHGSIMLHLTKDFMERLPVHFPKDIGTQKYISDVLSTIDAKIDCNNRINTELASMARMLYDYWFVQFDFPDLKGKPYKSSGGVMVFNKELNRDIPADWRNVNLSSITQVSNETLNPSDFPQKEFKHFSIPVFDATKTFAIEKGSSIGSNKFLVKSNDIMVSKLNPWFNRVILGLVDDDQICSTELVVWRQSSENIRNFLYLIATSSQFISHCVQSATGTSNSHKRVNPTVMMSFSIPYEPSIAEKFGDIVSPLIQKMSINQKENEQLIKLRDWLLPMLMNGQVTVSH